MKKLMIAALAIIGFSTATFAQAAPAAKKSEPSKLQVVKKPTEAKVVDIKKTAVTPAAAKPATAAKPAATTGTAPLKKDGTPDKRYKNAAAAPAAGPVKKDGTPDKRYKANKKG
jgi:hypothetical protein